MVEQERELAHDKAMQVKGCFSIINVSCQVGDSLPGFSVHGRSLLHLPELIQGIMAQER